MTMLIGGTWQAAASGRTEDVTSPFDGTITGTSGIGKEGPRSAVAEMTDVKTVILHGRPW
jgi:acyl-CoA reductase-like NAD-dependent aldehyde dehydrogenase